MRHNGESIDDSVSGQAGSLPYLRKGSPVKSYLSLSLSLLLSISLSAFAQDKPPAPPKSNPLNEPLGDPGVIPAGADGMPLNLNFEDGTLKDWKAEGKAFEKQPVKGE